jgi:hypothetical protein
MKRWSDHGVYGRRWQCLGGRGRLHGRGGQLIGDAGDGSTVAGGGARHVW